MKVTIRILSQTVLADPKVLPGMTPRLKVYGSTEVTMPEPIQGNDANTLMMRWWYSYQRILKDDPSAVMKIVPHVVEPQLPF